MPEITVPENIIQKDSAREGSFLNKAVSFEPQNVEVKDGGSGIIVIGRVESGIEKLAEYSGSVDITFALEQDL